MYGITERAVRYHVQKLTAIGLVERIPSTPKTYPYSIIVPSTVRLASCASQHAQVFRKVYEEELG